MWDVRIRRDERGWYAEFRIPFSTIRSPERLTSRYHAGRFRSCPGIGGVLCRCALMTNGWPITMQTCVGSQ